MLENLKNARIMVSFLKKKIKYSSASAPAVLIFTFVCVPFIAEGSLWTTLILQEQPHGGTTHGWTSLPPLHLCPLVKISVARCPLQTEPTCALLPPAKHLPRPPLREPPPCPRQPPGLSLPSRLPSRGPRHAAGERVPFCWEGINVRPH